MGIRDWERGIPKSLNGFLLAGMLLVLPACSDRDLKAQSPPTPTANTSENLFIKDELYFGLSKPGGGVISDPEWQLFLSRVITPAFNPAFQKESP